MVRHIPACTVRAEGWSGWLKWATELSAGRRCLSTNLWAWRLRGGMVCVLCWCCAGVALAGVALAGVVLAECALAAGSRGNLSFRATGAEAYYFANVTMDSAMALVLDTVLCVGLQVRTARTL